MKPIDWLKYPNPDGMNLEELVALSFQIVDDQIKENEGNRGKTLKDTTRRYKPTIHGDKNA